MMPLHESVATARKQKGMTQEQLAEMTNITVRTIQRIESGESTPRPYTLKTIASALGTTFELLTQTGIASGKPSETAAERVAVSEVKNEQHSLQLIALSCFSYLIIPWVHFLVPNLILKKAKLHNPEIIAAGRRMITVQIYWIVALHVFMLLSLAYNLIITIYFGSDQVVNYLWLFFIFYFINLVIIAKSLWQINRTDYTHSIAQKAF